MSGQYLRRYLLSIIMIVTFALILNGQDQPLMGLGGGGNISHFTGSRWTIFYQHSLGQKWGWRSSLNYIRKVNDYPFLLPDEGVDQIKTHSDYVQIDLGIRGSIDFEKTSLYFLTGPYAGLARKHQVRSISDEPPVESDDLELLDWDWGWFLSAGVRKQINGRQMIFTSFRWEFGALDILTNQNFSLRNNDKLITLGMLFVLHPPQE